MTMLQKVYSVLLVSASEKLNTFLMPQLPGASYFPVHKVKSISSAKRLLSEKSYDFLIINSPLPDETGVDFAIDLGQRKNMVVLLIVRHEIYDEIFDRIALQGVFPMSRPFSVQTFTMALDWLSIIRERIRSEEQKELSLEEKMNEIRLVNRAKWLLIRERNMDEPQAHRYIEKQAMDRCISKKEVAESLIRFYPN